MFRKICYLIIITVLLTCIPAICTACNFTWTINNYTFTCEENEHEYTYTSIGSGKHSKKIVHTVRDNLPIWWPDPTATWEEEISTENCTKVTIPAVPATCTETGLTTGYKCRYCEQIITEPSLVPKTSHKFVNDAAVAATCTESGLTAGRHCSICGYITQTQQIIAALGHIWGTETIVSPATNTDNGIYSHTCSRCNTTEDVEFASLSTAEGECGDNVYWHTEVLDPLTAECSLILSGEGNMQNWTSASKTPWYRYRQNIHNVIIEDGITNIGSYAFSNLENVTDITIGKDVESIGSYAFAYTTGLLNVYYPRGVNEIGSWLFMMGSGSTVNHVYYNSETYRNMKSLNLTFAFYTMGTIDNITWMLDSEGTLSFTGNGVLTSILAGEAEPEKIKKVIIGEGITAISGNAFYNSTIREVHLPMSLTDIGGAFSGSMNIVFFCDYPFGTDICSQLSAKGSIIRSSYPMFKIKQVVNDDSSFSLKIHGYNGDFFSIVIPADIEGIPITEIGTFMNNHHVEQITFEADLSELPESIFQNCDQLQTVILPSSLAAIPEYAFHHCTSLTDITLPETISAIGSYAFEECNSLTGISIPSHVISIPSYAFAYCSSLSSVSFPEALRTIGSYAFYECPLLQQLSFSENLNRIEQKAFSQCIGLTEIHLPSQMGYIGDNAFNGCCDLTDINIPQGLTELNSGLFKGCDSLTEIHVSQSVKRIYSHAFSDCSDLRKIILPDDLTSFDKSSINNCSSLIEVIYDPDSGTASLLEQYGFLTTYTGCVLHGTVKINNRDYDISDLFTKPAIGNGAGPILEWSADGKLFGKTSGFMTQSASVNSNQLYKLFIRVLDLSGELTMPQSLERIEEEAFAYNPAQQLYISDQCTWIESNAFYGSNCVFAEIPDSVTNIADDAFPCTLHSVKTNSFNSAVTEWCDHHGVYWYVQ